MNWVPASRGRASFGIEKAATPVAGSYSAAWTVDRRCDGPNVSCIDAGSTPDFASETFATIVGRPLESVLVRIFTVGGLTSFTHDRSVYLPASDLPVKRSRPESTDT